MTDLTPAVLDPNVVVIRESLLRLQGWLKPGALKWSRDGLDALSEVVAALDAERARNRNLEAAISQASYALDPNQGEPSDPSLAHQWLRTTFPPDHPNYVDPAALAVLEEPQ